MQNQASNFLQILAKYAPESMLIIAIAMDTVFKEHVLPADCKRFGTSVMLSPAFVHDLKGGA